MPALVLRSPVGAAAPSPWSVSSSEGAGVAAVARAAISDSAAANAAGRNPLPMGGKDSKRQQRGGQQRIAPKLRPVAALFGLRQPPLADHDRAPDVVDQR